MSKTDHGLLVNFYSHPVHMVAKSEAAGRPIYEDCDHVNIIIPGDKLTEIDRPATDKDREDYALEYARYKNRDREAVSGTPLAQWPAMRPSVIKEFEALNIRTVEHLANLSATGQQAFGMGAGEWVKRAQAYLETAENTAAAQKYAVENDELKSRIAELERLVKELGSERRGPGRPPKVSEAA